MNDFVQSYCSCGKYLAAGTWTGSVLIFALAGATRLLYLASHNRHDGDEITALCWSVIDEAPILYSGCAAGNVFEFACGDIILKHIQGQIPSSNYLSAQPITLVYKSKIEISSISCSAMEDPKSGWNNVVLVTSVNHLYLFHLPISSTFPPKFRQLIPKIPAKNGGRNSSNSSGGLHSSSKNIYDAFAVSCCFLNSMTQNRIVASNILILRCTAEGYAMLFCSVSGSIHQEFTLSSLLGLHSASAKSSQTRTSAAASEARSNPCQDVGIAPRTATSDPKAASDISTAVTQSMSGLFSMVANATGAGPSAPAATQNNGGAGELPSFAKFTQALVNGTQHIADYVNQNVGNHYHDDIVDKPLGGIQKLLPFEDLNYRHLLIAWTTKRAVLLINMQMMTYELLEGVGSDISAMVVSGLKLFILRDCVNRNVNVIDLMQLLSPHVHLQRYNASTVFIAASIHKLFNNFKRKWLKNRYLNRNHATTGSVDHKSSQGRGVVAASVVLGNSDSHAPGEAMPASAALTSTTTAATNTAVSELQTGEMDPRIAMRSPATVAEHQTIHHDENHEEEAVGENIVNFHSFELANFKSSQRYSQNNKRIDFLFDGIEQELTQALRGADLEVEKLVFAAAEDHGLSCFDTSCGLDSNQVNVFDRQVSEHESLSLRGASHPGVCRRRLRTLDDVIREGLILAADNPMSLSGKTIEELVHLQAFVDAATSDAVIARHSILNRVLAGVADMSDDTGQGSAKSTSDEPSNEDGGRDVSGDEAIDKLLQSVEHELALSNMLIAADMSSLKKVSSNIANLSTPEAGIPDINEGNEVVEHGVSDSELDIHANCFKPEIWYSDLLQDCDCLINSSSGMLGLDIQCGDVEQSHSTAPVISMSLSQDLDSNAFTAESLSILINRGNESSKMLSCPASFTPNPTPHTNDSNWYMSPTADSYDRVDDPNALTPGRFIPRLPTDDLIREGSCETLEDASDPPAETEAAATARSDQCCGQTTSDVAVINTVQEHVAEEPASIAEPTHHSDGVAANAVLRDCESPTVHESNFEASWLMDSEASWLETLWSITDRNATKYNGGKNASNSSYEVNFLQRMRDQYTHRVTAVSDRTGKYNHHSGGGKLGNSSPISMISSNAMRNYSPDLPSTTMAVAAVPMSSEFVAVGDMAITEAVAVDNPVLEGILPVGHGLGWSLPHHYRRKSLRKVASIGQMTIGDSSSESLLPCSLKGCYQVTLSAENGTGMMIEFLEEGIPVVTGFQDIHVVKAEPHAAVGASGSSNNNSKNCPARQSGLIAIGDILVGIGNINLLNIRLDEAADCIRRLEQGEDKVTLTFQYGYQLHHCNSDSHQMVDDSAMVLLHDKETNIKKKIEVNGRKDIASVFDSSDVMRMRQLLRSRHCYPPFAFVDFVENDNNGNEEQLQLIADQCNTRPEWRLKRTPSAIDHARKSLTSVIATDNGHVGVNYQTMSDCIVNITNENIFAFSYQSFRAVAKSPSRQTPPLSPACKASRYDKDGDKFGFVEIATATRTDGNSSGNDDEDSEDDDDDDDDDDNDASLLYSRDIVKLSTLVPSLTVSLQTTTAQFGTNSHFNTPRHGRYINGEGLELNATQSTDVNGYQSSNLSSVFANSMTSVNRAKELQLKMTTEALNRQQLMSFSSKLQNIRTLRKSASGSVAGSIVAANHGISIHATVDGLAKSKSDRHLNHRPRTTRFDPNSTICRYLPSVEGTHTLLDLLSSDPGLVLRQPDLVIRILTLWSESFENILSPDNREHILLSKSQAHSMAVTSGIFPDGKALRHCIHAVGELLSLLYLLKACPKRLRIGQQNQNAGGSHSPQRTNSTGFVRDEDRDLWTQKSRSRRDNNALSSSAVTDLFSFQGIVQSKLCRLKCLPIYLVQVEAESASCASSQSCLPNNSFCVDEAEAFINTFGAYLNLDVVVAGSSHVTACDAALAVARTDNAFLTGIVAIADHLAKYSSLINHGRKSMEVVEAVAVSGAEAEWAVVGTAADVVSGVIQVTEAEVIADIQASPISNSLSPAVVVTAVKDTDNADKHQQPLYPNPSSKTPPITPTSPDYAQRLYASLVRVVGADCTVLFCMILSNLPTLFKKYDCLAIQLCVEMRAYIDVSTVKSSLVGNASSELISLPACAAEYCSLCCLPDSSTMFNIQFCERLWQILLGLQDQSSNLLMSTIPTDIDSNWLWCSRRKYYLYLHQRFQSSSCSFSDINIPGNYKCKMNLLFIEYFVMWLVLANSQEPVAINIPSPSVAVLSYADDYVCVFIAALCVNHAAYSTGIEILRDLIQRSLLSVDAINANSEPHESTRGMIRQPSTIHRIGKLASNLLDITMAKLHTELKKHCLGFLLHDRQENAIHVSSAAIVARVVNSSTWSLIIKSMELKVKFQFLVNFIISPKRLSYESSSPSMIGQCFQDACVSLDQLLPDLASIWTKFPLNQGEIDPDGSVSVAKLWEPTCRLVLNELAIVQWNLIKLAPPDNTERMPQYLMDDMWTGGLTDSGCSGRGWNNAATATAATVVTTTVLRMNFLAEYGGIRMMNEIGNMMLMK